MTKICQTELASQRRNLLENSLVSLLEERRYSDITVKDICVKAGIPRRTFYHYFDCKDTVLHAVLEDMLNECSLEAMLEFNAGFDAMKESLIRNFRYWSGAARRKLDLLLENDLAGEMGQCALKWLESRRSDLPRRPGVTEKEKEIFAMVCVAGFFTLLLYWRRNAYRETPEEMAEIAVRALSEPLLPC